MNTMLNSWITNASVEQKCDILYQLVVLALSGEPVGSDPSEVVVGDDGLVEIVPHELPHNLAWQAPEVLSGRNTDYGAPQSLYTLSLMAFWMFTGYDYFSHHFDQQTDALPEDRIGGYRIVYRGVQSDSALTPGDDLPERFTRNLLANMGLMRDYVQYSHLFSINGGGIALWASADPHDRVAGANQFVRYLHQTMPGVAKVMYVYDGHTVYEESRTISGDVTLDAGAAVGDGGWRIAQQVVIPYRPGSHAYRVHVQMRSEGVEAHRGSFNKAVYLPKSFATGHEDDSRDIVKVLDLDGDGVKTLMLNMAYPNCVLSIVSTNPDGSVATSTNISLPKPQGYDGGVYLLTLGYDHTNGHLYAFIKGLDGRIWWQQDMGQV